MDGLGWKIPSVTRDADVSEDAPRCRTHAANADPLKEALAALAAPETNTERRSHVTGGAQPRMSLTHTL
jgi:hypothetical protein